MLRLSLLSVTFLLMACSESREMSKLDLITFLLNNRTYHKAMTPEPDSVTNVDVQIEIFEIAKSEGKDTEFRMSLFLRMWWTDLRLNFTELSNRAKLDLAERDVRKLWLPDVFFLRSKQQHEVTTKKMMYLYRDGSVVYSER